MKKSFLLTALTIVMLTSSVHAKKYNEKTHEPPNPKSRATIELLKIKKNSKENQNKKQQDILIFTDPQVKGPVGKLKDYPLILKVKNPHDYDVTISAATAFNVANGIEFHANAGEGKRRGLTKIVIPAGKEVDLDKSGYYLELQNTKKDIEIGETFDLKLTLNDKVQHVQVRISK